jgi:predicted amidophosphoribosyltransferase
VQKDRRSYLIPSKMDLAEQLLKLQQSLFPRSCSLCREALNPKQQILCSGCIDDLPYNNNCCLRCAEPLVSNGICPTCQKSPPNYRLCHTLCAYSHPISSAIKSIKKNLLPQKQNNLAFYLLNNYKLFIGLMIFQK